MKATCVSLGIAVTTLAALAAGIAGAQEPASPFRTSLQANPPVNNQISTGTTICVALTKTIDAKNAKPGDPITARVTLPVLAKGQVVFGEDSKIAGHVVSARKRSDGERSELAVVFDHAVLKDGGQIPLALTVQAIGRPAITAADIPPEDRSNPAPFGGARTGPTVTSRQQQTTGGPPSMPPDPLSTSVPNLDEPKPQHPVLDTGSHGAVGLPNLTLTESTGPGSGSVVRANKSDVRLEGGMEMVLRVVAAPGGDQEKRD